jgi:hypothetical protein
MYEPIFGALPSQFEVDMAVRSGIEQEVRRVESGFVPPCRPGDGAARYLSGFYYLVLFEDRPSGWRTFMTFNYRLDGPQMLRTKSRGRSFTSPGRSS